jgi:hypothetical protein
VHAERRFEPTRIHNEHFFELVEHLLESTVGLNIPTTEIIDLDMTDGASRFPAFADPFDERPGGERFGHWQVPCPSVCRRGPGCEPISDVGRVLDMVVVTTSDTDIPAADRFDSLALSGSTCSRRSSLDSNNACPPFTDLAAGEPKLPRGPARGGFLS